MAVKIADKKSINDSQEHYEWKTSVTESILDDSVFMKSVSGQNLSIVIRIRNVVISGQKDNIIIIFI